MTEAPGHPEPYRDRSPSPADGAAIPGDDDQAESFRDHLEKARRLVALELDLAETAPPGRRG